jgi:hypothetical protein
MLVNVGKFYKNNIYKKPSILKTNGNTNLFLIGEGAQRT